MFRTALILIATVLACSPPGLAQEAAVQQGYLKSSVAEFDEPDRSKLLSFLAECRKTTDSVVKSLSDNDLSNASKIASPEALKQWRAAGAAFKEFRQQEPAIMFQYRNQALEVVGAQAKLTSRVWYALVSATPVQAKSFVSVVVEESPSGHAGRVIAVEPIAYAQDVPTWLLRVDAPVAPSQ